MAAIAGASMSKTRSIIDATPRKRIYRTIIADYGLNTAICELIDNAIDAWMFPKTTHALKIAVHIDVDQQSIRITDNSGGVKRDELRKLISPGDSSLSGDDHTIGIFGVGSKRAVVALAQCVQITTRYRKQGTYRIRYDDDWLNCDSWHLPVEVVSDNIAPSSTSILMSRLRFHVTGEAVTSLKRHLAATYAYLVKRSQITLELNGEKIAPTMFDGWAYPPSLEPRTLSKKLKVPDTKHTVDFEITGGLRLEREEASTDYGVYIYCNKRLIVRSLQAAEVGYVTGVAGLPHFDASLARVLVFLDGPSESMPWNSSKTGLNYNHVVFEAIKKDVAEVVKTYSAISRRVSDDYETRVKPYESGDCGSP